MVMVLQLTERDFWRLRHDREKEKGTLTLSNYSALTPPNTYLC